MSAWIDFTGVLIKLPFALDADMRCRAGISHFEYLVSIAISEGPDDSAQPRIADE